MFKNTNPVPKKELKICLPFFGKQALNLRTKLVIFFAYVLNGWSTKACGVWRSVIFLIQKSNRVVASDKRNFSAEEKTKNSFVKQNGFALKKRIRRDQFSQV